MAVLAPGPCSACTRSPTGLLAVPGRHRPFSCCPSPSAQGPLSQRFPQASLRGQAVQTGTPPLPQVFSFLLLTFLHSTCPLWSSPTCASPGAGSVPCSASVAGRPRTAPPSPHGDLDELPPHPQRWARERPLPGKDRVSLRVQSQTRVFT